MLLSNLVFVLDKLLRISGEGKGTERLDSTCFMGYSTLPDFVPKSDFVSSPEITVVTGVYMPSNKGIYI